MAAVQRASAAVRFARRPLPDDRTACACVGPCLLTSTCAVAASSLCCLSFLFAAPSLPSTLIPCCTALPHVRAPAPHPTPTSTQPCLATRGGRSAGASTADRRRRPPPVLAGPPAGGHDLTTFVSATGPGAQPQILKNATQKKVAAAARLLLGSGEAWHSWTVATAGAADRRSRREAGCSAPIQAQRKEALGRGQHQIKCSSSPRASLFLPCCLPANRTSSFRTRAHGPT